uniref:Ig-like domain-containing protein n=1 Tax=Leptobrachium leishanense TaxID=445787 RepID=A0A8C5N364_9ANUR
MIPAPVFTLIFLFTYCAAQITITQPVSQSVSLGDTVRLPCTLNGHSISDRTVRWLQQQSGNKPRFLLSYASDSSKHQGTGVPDRFSGSKDSPQNVGYLTIKGVLLEDDADYHCVIWFGEKFVFGGGTKMIVLGEVKPPTLSLFPPSTEEISTGKATFVCSLAGFYPRTVSVKWLVDGIEKTGETSLLSQQNDNTYIGSSYLTMTASEWQKQANTVCKVTHQGKDFVQTLKRSECMTS